ncbi:carbohydrate kinase [Fibrisoma montanum]|uniref:Carbohydrate kinase n=1 Tax=Fibrisoma montanum TaxID=2305895 RepID=A0A418MDX1_9BACT|nr:carbohydrate kinase [Fibrisoma montanum]RIV24992.1 carbohydrate kinase [Fibrisoma montanum]
MTPILVCFGETLWDVLPSGKQPGGAPMNVAVHLRNFGLDARMISRVGEDDPGNELLDFIAGKGIPTDTIQRGQTHLTGIVKANVSDCNEVTYKIVQPVAWDYIQYDESLARLVEQADVFIYGSLAARSQTSRDTLYRLLKTAPLKVFDVNIRPPHYSREIIEHLLAEADIVKMNHHELTEIAAWYGTHPGEAAAMQALMERFSVRTLCVTRGEKGAVLLNQDGFVQQAGFPVTVADTIGSGDAFLAAFLSKTLQGESAQKTLAFACAAGAYVATQRGATPDFSEQTITNAAQMAMTA